jgi:hypothetical protein
LAEGTYSEVSERYRLGVRKVPYWVLHGTVLGTAL